MERRAAPAHVDVVAVERDVERPDRDLLPRELLDEAAEPVRERNAARVDADEGGAVEIRVPLDDLVGDAGDRPAEGLSVEHELLRLCRRSHQRLLSGLTGPS
jgi:hypothetical protein